MSTLHQMRAVDVETAIAAAEAKAASLAVAAVTKVGLAELASPRAKARAASGRQFFADAPASPDIAQGHAQDAQADASYAEILETLAVETAALRKQLAEAHEVSADLGKQLAAAQQVAVAAGSQRDSLLASPCSFARLCVSRSCVAVCRRG